MSYYVTHENSVLNINNAHLKVSGNVQTDVLKLGAMEFAPPSSDVPGTVNFTNVTTGVTTTSNLNVGGTLQLGTVEVVATTHTLENTTALGNVTSNTIQFTNATTGIVTTGNVEVGGELTMNGNATVSSNLVVSGNVEVGTANLFVDTVNSRVGVRTTSPDTTLDVDGTITGRIVTKTRTITKGTSLSGEVDTFTLGNGENRIILNNAQGSASSSREYTANFNSGVPTEIGTVLYLEINSSRTNSSSSGVNHKSEIQLDGTKVLSTENNYLSAGESYVRNFKRQIILTSNGWKDFLAGIVINTGSTAIPAISFDRYSSGHYRTDIYQNANGLDIRVGQGNSYPPSSVLYLKRISDGTKRVEMDTRLLTIKQGNRPGASTNTHGIKMQNTDNTNYWNLFISNNDHFRFAYNGGAKGYVDQNDGNAQMNFTGQHRTFIKDTPFTEAENLEGLIVSADQNKYIKMSGGIETGSNAITMNETLPVVSLSVTAKDKKCFGVISASEDPESRTEQYGVFGSNFEKEKGDTRVYINSVGEGAIWVTNINGPLESGDYITTSAIKGYGQKQDSEFLTNYTVAKITMDCDFEPVTQPVQVIKKDEEGENILDEHGQIQWEDHPTETEKVYKIRYLDADGNITDEASAVHKAAFVGCTYHCG